MIYFLERLGVLASPPVRVSGSVFLVALALAGNEGGAAEWSIETTVNQRFQVDDNPRLRSEGSTTAFGSTTSPETRYRYRDPVLDISLYGRLDFSRFNEKELNSEDQTFRLDSDYTQQRSVWGLDADFARESTRTSEVTDTGILEDIATRVRYSLRPSYAYQLSQIDVVRLDVGYTDVSYDTDILIDYTHITIGSSWSRNLSQLTALTLSANAARQDTENEVTSDVYGVQAGVRHTFSPRLEGNVSVGPQFVSQESPLQEQNSVGVSFAAGVTYAWSERTSLSARASQSIEPSGGGASRNRLKFGVLAEHRYTQRLNFSFSADYQDDSDPDGENSSFDRTYFSFSPRVRWQMSQEWDLSGSYRYRRHESSGGSEADSHAVFVTLNYHPIAWFIAR